MIFEPCLEETVHLCCTNSNTISIRTETRFHLSLVTLEFHRVRPKWFLSLLYIRHKPCTYLALLLTLYPNGPKRDSTWPLSPRSSIGCGRKWFPSLVWKKPCTYLALILTLSPNRPKQDSTWASSHRSSIGCIQNDFRDQCTFGAKLAPILHLG